MTNLLSKENIVRGVFVLAIIGLFLLGLVLADESGTPPNITFIGDTPANSSMLNTTSIVVNVSSADDNGEHYVATNFDKSLVGWWRMDNLNSSGGVVDYTGVNNGTRIGAVINSSSGRFGNGSWFDGQNDYIRISGISASSKHTISVWIKTNATSTSAGYGNYILDSLTGRTIVSVGEDVAQGDIRYFDGTWHSSGVLVTDNKWHNIVFISNLSERKIVYIDGILSINQSAKPKFIGGTTIIGARYTGEEANFNGSIDEVMIFNRSLSASEISALYNASANKYYNNFTGLSEGTHTFKSYAVDLAGNLNSTEQRSIIINRSYLSSGSDTIYPTFFSYWDNNATIIGSGIGRFNVSVNDTNGTVILKINNNSLLATDTSYCSGGAGCSLLTTQSLCIGGLCTWNNIFNASYSFALSGSYSYNWTSFGNGTLHNTNISLNRYYTVNLTGDTCTYGGSGIWALNCADNCVFATTQTIPTFNNITITGAGALNFSSGGKWSFSGSSQYVTIASGCTLNIDPGGGWNY